MNTNALISNLETNLVKLFQETMKQDPFDLIEPELNPYWDNWRMKP